MTSETNNYKDLISNLLGSATAGSFARTLCHPIDTCKAKLQSSELFKGLRDVTKTTFKAEGFRGFFPGLGAVLVGGVPGVCIYITSYDACKNSLSKVKVLDDYEFVTYLTSGMFAEALCCLFFVPVDVIKERMQIQSNQYKNPYRNSADALKTILRQEGVRGIYKGYYATLSSFGPFSALYFLMYEESKKKIHSYRREQRNVTKSLAATDLQSSSPPPLACLDNLLCSTTASCAASWLTNPLDMAKLRYQVQRNEDVTVTDGTSSSSSRRPYKGLIDVMRSVYMEHGFKGLWRGAGARVLFQSPSVAITMTMYEECRALWMRVLSS